MNFNSVDKWGTISLILTKDDLKELSMGSVLENKLGIIDFKNILHDRNIGVISGDIKYSFGYDVYLHMYGSSGFSFPNAQSLCLPKADYLLVLASSVLNDLENKSDISKMLYYMNCSGCPLVIKLEK